MQHPAVHWHEGLFLRPHHLQAWDRHWEEKTTSAHRWSNANDYGIATVDIDADALAAGYFQLNAIRCKMPEGGLVEIHPGEAVRRRDLRPALATNDPNGPATGDSVDVFFAVSRLQLGSANVSEPRLYQPPESNHAIDSPVPIDPPSADTREVEAMAAGRRFESLQVQFHDEVDAASVEPILVRRINARLMLSTEDSTGYETIRIARVLRGVDGGEIARLDERIIPPILHAGGSQTLRGGILSRLRDRMLHRAELLGDWINQGGASGTFGVTEMRQVLALQTLQQAAAVLGSLHASKGIHPETIYLEMTRIVGSLQWLDPEFETLALPAYDHEDLGTIFHNLMRRIESRIASLGRREFQQRFFTVAGPGAHVEIDDAWLQRDQVLLLGVRRGGVPASQLQRWLLAGELDCKWGSQRQVDGLFRQRVAGVELMPTSRDTALLPASSQWSYFEFRGGGPAWDDVQSTRSLAVRFREQTTSTPTSEDTPSGSASQMNPHSITLDTNDGVTELQFALFVLPQ